MKNAGDLTYTNQNLKLLLVGGAGAGKTTQFRTLPGRTFMYIFDPNAERSLVGAANIDYEIFNVEMLDLGVKPLSNKIKGDFGRPDEPRTYTAWEAHYEEAIESAFFMPYDFIGFDSLTTFADVVMDRVQYLNGRLGRHPEIADYTAQMALITNVFRVLTSMGKGLIATGHEKPRTEEVTKRTEYMPMLTGELRVRLPLLFTDILYLYNETIGDSIIYEARTGGDSLRQFLRCSLPFPKPTYDVTLTSFDRDVCVYEGLSAMYDLNEG